MGANVELDIFLKKGMFSLKYIFTLLEAKGFQINIKDIQIFDDWYYTNEINIDPDAIERDLDGIYLEKFTRIYFIVNATWRCTLLTSIEDGYLNLSFGLDTDNLFQNGDHGLEDSIRALLNSITTSIIDAFEDSPLKELFLVASMGIEHSVDFDRNVVTMLTDQNNDGVVRWILPAKSGKDIVLNKFFIKEEKGNYIIFTIKKSVTIEKYISEFIK